MQVAISFYNDTMKEILSRRIGIRQVRELVAMVAACPARRVELWRLASDADRITAGNALWVLTHMPPEEQPWLESLQNEMIDMLLRETVTGKKRMLLQLLRVQEYDPACMRTDLLDYCLDKINAECEPYAVRCFSIYTAFKMCRHFPELLVELQTHLDLLSTQALSPGLRCALRHTRRDIARLLPQEISRPDSN